MARRSADGRRDLRKDGHRFSPTPLRTAVAVKMVVLGEANWKSRRYNVGDAIDTYFVELADRLERLGGKLCRATRS
jgi:hypothetical protein